MRYLSSLGARDHVPPETEKHSESRPCHLWLSLGSVHEGCGLAKLELAFGAAALPFYLLPCFGLANALFRETLQRIEEVASVG